MSNTKIRDLTAVLPDLSDFGPALMRAAEAVDYTASRTLWGLNYDEPDEGRPLHALIAMLQAAESEDPIRDPATGRWIPSPRTLYSAALLRIVAGEHGRQSDFCVAAWNVYWKALGTGVSAVLADREPAIAETLAADLATLDVIPETATNR